MTDHKLEDRQSVPGMDGHLFPSVYFSTIVLGPMQSPVQWVLETFARNNTDRARGPRASILRL